VDAPRDSMVHARGKHSADRGGVVIVVPKAGGGTAEHFAHTYALAERLRELVSTAVIVERVVGSPPARIHGVEVLIQSRADSMPFLRMLELAGMVLRLRRDGYRSFFVRTSTTAAVPIALIAHLTGGRTLYWNCGKAPKRGLRALGLREVLAYELPFRLALRLSDRVVTGTPSLADHYSRTYGIDPKRVSVLPNEIDLDRYRPPTDAERVAARAELGIEPHDKVVLTVHRLSPVRQTLRYVPSVPELVADAVPEARFLIAGGGPEEPALRRRLARSSLGSRVRLIGNVPHQATQRLYQSADAFFMPSYTEGFPRVLLEAMAFGVPFAATDVGGVPEIVPEPYRRRLADRERPAALARALIEILTDPESARALAIAGRDWVVRYDSRHVARQLAALAAAI
jgi:glycosyltransferase involved in cell wall biosynthesis